MNGYITHVADEIADILLRECIDYVQSKAVFRAVRIKAGLHAPKETRNAPARLTLEEQLRFIDAAYARNGRTGLMVQTLLETGTRVFEFVAMRVEDVGLGERTITVENGKGGKRREIPIRAENPLSVLSCRKQKIAGLSGTKLVERSHQGPRRAGCRQSLDIRGRLRPPDSGRTRPAWCGTASPFRSSLMSPVE